MRSCSRTMFTPDTIRIRNRKLQGSNKGHASFNVQYSCVFVGCHLRRKVFEFAVSHETHKAKVGRVHSTPTAHRPPVSQSSKSQWTEARGLHLGLQLVHE